MERVGRNSIPKSMHILVLLKLLLCFGAINGEAQGSLPADEIQALGEIAAEIGKKDWNFSENPCLANSSSWMLKSPSSDQDSTVFCNFSFSGGVCHVQSIFLPGQDLSGVLPPSLSMLPHIKEVDFSLNYLSGNIPQEWASTKLEKVTVAVNMLSGTIPDYLGNISTLTLLNMENNMFSGTIPFTLGDLVNLDLLNLNSNFLTGEFPASLSKLTKLTVFKINSNNFTGRIPDVIKNWKNLERINMQSSGFEGPIPSNTFSMFNDLTELLISDLDNGERSEFPLLRDLKKLKQLMLRSCNLFGPVPPYLSEMANLTFLDLSFNKLEGNIPEFQNNLASLEKVYFTGNLLNGTVPNWIIARTMNYRQKTDLSYNNFSEGSEPPSCANMNLFRSFSLHGNSTPLECMDRVKPCLEDKYSLHINCGGHPTTIGRIYYEGDTYEVDAAKLIFPSDNTWGISNTGNFGSQTSFIANNVSKLEMDNSELYTTARLSALSLAYYGHCLANGNYTVKLHFSEIIIRDNKSSQSLPRRVFDVYIQDKLELRDFDIKKVKGVDKELVKEFKAVEVKDKSIEIRFYWAGKGTTSGPRKGTFGPLISAISVESEFDPPPVHSKRSKNSGETVIVIGVVVSSLCLICLILGVLWWKFHFNASKDNGNELRGLDLQTGLFSFRQIKAATNNFDPANKIGEGGFGAVFKGVLSDGTIIAVKQLSAKSKQGNREFVNEIGMISGLQHPNLVRLYGCCTERNQLLLVYEYMENNSLARALFGTEVGVGGLNLDWTIRQNICIGIARGLAFLHEESTLKIVHRDIKTTNVLLDGNLNPKISDFGLAKLDEEEHTHITTRVAGTIGYMAPEYALWGYLSYKADVYSFGVVALEIVAGKYNMKYRPKENYVGLVDWALNLQQKGDLMEFVDPKLGSDFNKEEVVRVIKVALLCTNSSPALRPIMSVVLSMLEGHTAVPELIVDPSIYGDPLRLEAIKEHFEQITLQSSTDQSQSLIASSALVDSSTTSSQDHY